MSASLDNRVRAANNNKTSSAINVQALHCATPSAECLKPCKTRGRCSAQARTRLRHLVSACNLVYGAGGGGEEELADAPPPMTTKMTIPSARAESGARLASCSARDGFTGFLPARVAFANASFFLRMSNCVGCAAGGEGGSVAVSWKTLRVFLLNRRTMVSNGGDCVVWVNGNSGPVRRRGDDAVWTSRFAPRNLASTSCFGSDLRGCTLHFGLTHSINR